MEDDVSNSSLKRGSPLNVPGLNGGLPAQTPQIETTSGQQVATQQLTEKIQGAAATSAQQTQANQQMDQAQIDKALQQLNRALEASGTKVVNDPKAPPNTLWLNVVDSFTGAVIERLPPEGLRQYAETASAKGLTLDLKS